MSAASVCNWIPATRGPGRRRVGCLLDRLAEHWAELLGRPAPATVPPRPSPDVEDESPRRGICENSSRPRRVAPARARPCTLSATVPWRPARAPATRERIVHGRVPGRAGRASRCLRASRTAPLQVDEAGPRCASKLSGSDEGPSPTRRSPSPALRSRVEERQGACPPRVGCARARASKCAAPRHDVLLPVRPRK